MSYYNIGTASVANGETTITFSVSLGSQASPVVSPGDLFADLAQPLVPAQRLASVDYAARTAELAVGWPGASMVDAPYEVRFTGITERSTAQTRRYLEQLGQLSALGIQPDAFGLFDDRAAYDTKPAGYIYLSLDGDAALNTAWTLYAKLSATSGDWDAGQRVPGEAGPAGPSGLIGVWKPGGWLTGTDYALKDVTRQDGSSYICLVAHTSGVFADDLTAGKWELVAEKGADGAPGADGADGAPGVVQAIVAGANISVDATDPANPVVSSSASGSIGGSTGAADNALLRADGTGGVTVQGSPVIVDDAGNISGVPVLSVEGIKFPATQNPSTDLNTLDDIEEGTFTPGVSFGGGSIGVAYTARTGLYYKVGKWVMVALNVELSAKGSSTGPALLTGLPFAVAVAATPPNFVGWANMASLSSPGALVSGTTIIPHNQGATGITQLSDANFTNTSNLYSSGVYQTSA